MCYDAHIGRDHKVWATGPGDTSGRLGCMYQPGAHYPYCRGAHDDCYYEKQGKPYLLNALSHFYLLFILY